MISKEIEAEVKRLYHAEHLTRNGIAKHCGIHLTTVNRILGLRVKEVPAPLLRTSVVDPYVAFLLEKLKEYPNIRSTRLFLMLVDRGFKGSVQQLRRRVQILRPGRGKRAHLPLTAFAGDQAQADWAHFGVIKIGKAERKLSCFVMVLSYSRWLYAIFTFDQTLESFLRCHVLAFHHFEGVAREIRYDNLKAAVIDRYGSAVRYNDGLLELAGHYHFRPSACNPYSGNEKGRVERAIRYIRDSFAVGRHFRDLSDANAQLTAWVNETANRRSWPDDRTRTIDQVWREEKERLMALPEHEFSCPHRRQVRSGKTPLVRFDRNDYSIPYGLVGKHLTLVATETTVSLFDAALGVATHQRTYDQGMKVIDRAHFVGLYDRGPGGETVTARAYVIQLIPLADRLFELMIDHGVPLGGATARLLELIAENGESIVRSAVDEALSKGISRPAFLVQLCHRLALNKTHAPSLPMELPDRPGVKNLNIKTHDPASYDSLAIRSSTKPINDKDQNHD